MIGETTLAMLYVPLFFYLFDRLKERNEASARSGGGEDVAAPRPEPASGAAPAAPPAKAD